jgi:magnesium-transporting ATPase (P-type)
MDYPPRSVKERLFSRGVILRSLFVGLIITTGALFGCLSTWWAGGWYFGQQLSTTSSLYIKGTTMTFAGIVAGQVGNVLSMRTKKISLFKTNLLDNKWVLASMVFQILALFIITSVPFMQNIVGVTALKWTDWAYLAIIPCAVIIGEELRKWGARRLDKKSSEKRIKEQPVSKLETKKPEKLETKNKPNVKTNK